MDTVQAVLLFVIVLLTILLIVLGVQVFFILKSLRATITRANRVLENTEEITESVSEPLTFITSLINGKNIIPLILKILGGKKKKENKE